MVFRRSLSKLLYRSYERLLIREIHEGPVPSHIAIIMDGNRRFAHNIGAKKIEGHYRGADVTENVLDWCWDIGVKQLTLYAFSTENFKRFESERDGLFGLIGLKLDELSVDERTHKRQMNVRAIGNIELLPKKLQDAITRSEEATKDYDRLNLNIALAYGGRRELVDAARLIAEKIQKGMLASADVDEQIISSHLYTGDALEGDVDLIIRTGGDKRVSNFLPWQSCGNECAAYFCAPFWPEFRKIDLVRAVRTYQVREREKQRNTIVRMVNLLAACGQVEAEEVVNRSRKILNIPPKEIRQLLEEISQHNRIMAEAIKW
ncbi:MAG: Tritrans,polycis-undecaprenyl-diphosphate synthase (GGDP specific) [Candidatus Argoarchaeum ethanivorans]|uniref:Tritrans,polycis-undecaprenyl-diphosphate synthase (geranylgeranyl-diphosphate specific) n=1 Tax=Candidatus Argoarchaeum ethanivorans TaxID=2608793 RepID=A0A811T907_9EURY|nr:MAG: Tritrans,polycis-undecaprenyl-diphosphate synthase (GGDP specific) [Candidatus Argoarchaeum ethanivorans]